MVDKKIFLVQRSFSGKRLHEKILNIIKNFENPYPPDIFTWDNQEQITDSRGKYNKMFFTIVENTKDDIAKLIVEEELENHEKCVELSSEELELLKTFCYTELQVLEVKEEIDMAKALLKKLQEVSEYG